jgi:hypothetical protein
LDALLGWFGNDVQWKMKESFHSRGGTEALALHRGEVTQQLAEIFDFILCGLSPEGIGEARRARILLMFGLYRRAHSIFTFRGPLTWSQANEMQLCYRLLSQYLAHWGLQKTEVTDVNDLGRKVHAMNVRLPRSGLTLL